MSAEHEKSKPELPIRPPRPHPQGCAVLANWRCRDCDTWNGVRDARRCFTCNSPRR